ncbi:hypothetical protein THAOC_23351, partial [Thalassiosira oceanica]
MGGGAFFSVEGEGFRVARPLSDDRQAGRQRRRKTTLLIGFGLEQLAGRRSKGAEAMREDKEEEGRKNKVIQESTRERAIMKRLPRVVLLAVEAVVCLHLSFAFDVNVAPRTGRVTSTTRLDAAAPRRSRRSASDRPRRPPPTSSPRSSKGTTQVEERKRAPHQFDHTKDVARPFVDDPVRYVKLQDPNEGAPLLHLGEEEHGTLVEEGSHIQSYSLDELFPEAGEFSRKFCSSNSFRSAMRHAMREDVFDSTPSYSGLSEKARRMLLLPDSSIQGSWNCKQFTSEDGQCRMKKLTEVLKEYLGEDVAPSGDEFMETVGALCGS